MTILGTGLSGLVGSRVVELLSPAISFQDVSFATGVDITHKEDVDRLIDASDASWVLHFAAKTDVDGTENERSLGEKGSAWIVNVTATKYIVDACRRTQKRLLYISTDYVFDGTKELYSEEDMPNPQGWYATTKYEGEKLVATLEDYAVIMRIANPYRATFEAKLDFVRKIIERLGNHHMVKAPSDQLFVPTFIDDIASAIKRLVDTNASGIYHVVGNDAVSPYIGAQKIAAVFGLDASHVRPTTFALYFAGRAPRPYRAVLKNDKIAKLGVRMSTLEEGLTRLRGQL